ncbi:hypothetical protein [Lacrimispora xylanisolvens]|uniref:hypothetical protein n=1 Tax=Lacrimispora xylanisolvens TaxID=384636 RepID=UPI0024026B44
MRKRFTLLAAAICLCSVLSAFPVYADSDNHEWDEAFVDDSSGSEYNDSETNGHWTQTESGWAYYDNNGNMKTGWFKDKGFWYYSDPSGMMIANAWITTGGNWYRTAGEGNLLQGSYKIGNQDNCYFNADSLQWENSILYTGKYTFDESTGSCTSDPREKKFDGNYTYAGDAKGNALNVGDKVILLDLAAGGLYGPYGQVTAIDGTNFQVYWYDYIDVLYGASHIYEFYSSSMRGVFTGVYDIPSYGWHTSNTASGIYKR